MSENQIQTAQVLQTVPIQTAVKPEEFEAIKRAAEADGWSVPAYVAEMAVRAAGAKLPAHGPVPININGQTIESTERWLTYRQIVDLAGMKGNPTVMYSVAGGGKTLLEGHTAAVLRGAHFDVCHTTNA